MATGSSRGKNQPLSSLFLLEYGKINSKEHGKGLYNEEKLNCYLPFGYYSSNRYR